MNDTSSGKHSGARRQRRCPLCGEPAAERFRPFCSARCRDIDLGRWLSGAYAVPAVDSDDDDDDDPVSGERDD